MTDAEGTPHGMIPRPVVLELLAAFRHYMGPFAKVIMKQEMTKMGISSQTLQRTHWPDLCGTLGEKIPDLQRRNKFAAKARQILT